MSKGGGKQTTSSTQTVDPEFKARALDVYNRALAIADSPYQAYSGQMVAGFTPQQLQAFNLFGQASTTGQQSIIDAQELARQAGAYQPQTISEAMAGYQNPYTQQVIDTTLADIERSRQVAQGQGAAQAVAAKAFGGSRQGVAEAETNRAALDQAARTAAQLRSQGFETAAGLGARDIAAAQQAMVQKLAAAGQLGQLGGAEQALLLQGAQGLFGAGSAQQQLEQARLQEAYNRFAEEQNYPTQQLQILLQALGMFPNPITTNQTTNMTQGAGQTVSQIGGAVGSLALAGSLF
jgi:hypothetical protein